MKIEAGKTYRMRNGGEAFIPYECGDKDDHPYVGHVIGHDSGSNDPQTWAANGSFLKGEKYN